MDHVKYMMQVHNAVVAQLCPACIQVTSAISTHIITSVSEQTAAEDTQTTSAEFA